MRTQDKPSAPELTRRSRFDFKPDRHYVLVQKPDPNWDGPQLDHLLDTVDPKTGADAYRIEADGADGAESRRATGSRQMVLLSCSKEFSDAQTRTNAQLSHDYAMKVTKPSPGDETEENLELRSAISITSRDK